MSSVQARAPRTTARVGQDRASIPVVNTYGGFHGFTQDVINIY